MVQESFEQFIRNNCAKAEWEIAKLNDIQAILQSTIDSGRMQRIYITKYDSILEFSVASAVAFDCLDNIPHSISSILLTKNSEYKLGSWCVEKVQGKVVYSIRQNVDINSVDFVKLVNFLVSECNEFDSLFIELDQHINSTNSSNDSSSYSDSFDWKSILQVGVETFLKILIENELNSWFGQYIQFDNFLFPVVLYIIQLLIFQI